MTQSAPVSFWQLGSNVLPRYENNSFEKTTLLASEFDEISVPRRAYKPVLGCQGHPKKVSPLLPCSEEE